ncbi:hypothetical protein NDU88_007547 [Pleurodeles waltl]|uniref:Uncharacterized protein n=1 Tax=Pleurodeles waltl TaxID=8319 RepID=A0AAV7U1J9_PLEWA|nr:hypothetical protein NDU88_007547 [Pleurodeles waltl]
MSPASESRGRGQHQLEVGLATSGSLPSAPTADQAQREKTTIRHRSPPTGPQAHLQVRPALRGRRKRYCSPPRSPTRPSSAPASPLRPDRVSQADRPPHSPPGTLITTRHLESLQKQPASST